MWSALSMSSEACPGATKCEFGGVCFAERARDLASEADVVVVNAHLYAINIATRGHVLPEHDVVVFDEAHDIEGIFSSMFGAEVRPTQLFALTRSIAGIIKDDRVTRGLERAGAGLLRAIEETSQPPRPGQPIGDVPLLEGTRGNQELTNALNAALLAVGSAQRALGNLPPEAVTKMRAKVHHARGAAAAFVTAVNECLSADESSVAWLENGNKIRTAPLDVGGVLDRWFWTEGRDTLARIHSGAPVPSDDYPDGDEEQDPVPPRSVVFTSATIPTRIGEQLHIPDPRLLRVGSPFDYRANSLLYVPQMPSPTKDPTAWRKAVTAQFAKLITAAGGRTLGLFTSTEAMHQNAKAIRDLVPFPILAQGDLPKRELLRLFSEDEQTSLFATRSFFQGVDVPGGSLSLVALDRIPFARPDDPLISARQEAAGGGQLGFQRVSVPLAATTLAQAAGRLIRSTRDQGVVAVMDPRLAEAGYRPQLLDPLPPMQRTRDETQVIAFLQKITLEGRKAA
jgi:ATP-dependent DNA helicase DinG